MRLTWDAKCVRLPGFTLHEERAAVVIDEVSFHGQFADDVDEIFVCRAYDAVGHLCEVCVLTIAPDNLS